MRARMAAQRARGAGLRRVAHHDLTDWTTGSNEASPTAAHARSGDRLELDRNAGLLSFDNVERWNRSQDRPRWRVLWLENRLDCRVWSYYCDLRRAMGTLHTMLSLSSSLSVPKQGPDLIVVGPRMTSHTYRLSDPLGISRAR